MTSTKLLVRYMRKKHNLLIGERTAEEIKINIGAAYRRPEVQTMEVRGRNLVTGLPKTIVVTSDETLEALREPALQIVDAVHNVLERTPPELAADIFDRGIVMTGGGSLLSGLDALIEEKTGITTVIAEDPLTAVAIGTGKFIEFAHGMTSALEASMGIGGGRNDKEDYNFFDLAGLPQQCGGLFDYIKAATVLIHRYRGKKNGNHNRIY